MKEYKILTQKANSFSGYDFNALEKEINLYAEQGWVVYAVKQSCGTNVSMYAFVVILERDKQ